MPGSEVISIDLGIESFPPLKSKNLVPNGLHVDHSYHLDQSDNTFMCQNLEKNEFPNSWCTFKK